MLTNKLKTHIIKLHQKKYRQKFGEFLVEGVKGVEEALRSSADIRAVILENSYKEDLKIKKIIKNIEKNKISVSFCSKPEGDKIKSTDTFPGIMAIIKINKHSEDDLANKSPIILMDSVGDPGNLGTVIRTANWFGIQNILLSEDSVDIYNEKTVRSTMGSVFYTKIATSKNIIESVEKLKKKGYTIVALGLDGEDIKKLKPKSKSVYIFGNESRGIRPELLGLVDKKYTIMGGGPAESLNLGVSAGILMSKLEL